MKNSMVSTSVKSDLVSIGAINTERLELFEKNTRDNSSLNVYRDKYSRVIFIENYFVGDDEYSIGAYRNHTTTSHDSSQEEYENIVDTQRRFNTLKQIISNKDILDFGCGKGDFLRMASFTAKKVEGVELQENFSKQLNSAGITCYKSICDIQQPKDVITLFHSFEHLAHPLSILKDLYARLKPNGDGFIIIEVPHARDFLIEHLAVESFIRHTLWSQHLILHTRESLSLFLSAAGFKNIMIEGVQRYNLANHLHWLVSNQPGGHKSARSIIETPELSQAYASSLARIDATDTLTAIATT